MKRSCSQSLRFPWAVFIGILLGVLSGCSDSRVEQIEVQVPAGVTVPGDMVYIPAGEFIMGHAEAPKTELGQKVFLKAFLIDRYEVARGDYRTQNPGYAVFPGKENYPVTLATFFEAEEYCRAVAKRLPTEAEWEKAARGTDGRKWPWRVYREHPNMGFSGFIPEAVDKHKSWISPYGLYGMGHNVWEWTADDYDFNGMPGAEQGKFKVLRGGLYQTHLVIKFSATWDRNYLEPTARYNFVGFRCARNTG
ncbi:MAG: hypothetical protein E2O44_07900 [Nitrospina sp.]|nr:MAG: hypothetical protein E2O44_07900 [Nitrospina sp.]